MKLFATIMLALMFGAGPALAAVEQCRFIQAKPDREACYERQEKALAAKRKPQPAADTTAANTSLRYDFEFIGMIPGALGYTTTGVSCTVFSRLEIRECAKKHTR